MDNQKRIASLAKELAALRQRHADHERSVAELERLGSKQAPLIAASRDKVAAKIVSVERRLAALQDEPDELEEILEAPMPDIEAISAMVHPAPSERADAQILNEIRAHATGCDEHAAVLAHHIRALHQKIVELRQRHGGRGPAAAVVVSALERCAARYFNGTVLRSLRGSPRPAQGGFKDQIALWEFMLQAPPRVPPSPAPPPPPPMISLKEADNVHP
jgi:hypothetical protein